MIIVKDMQVQGNTNTSTTSPYDWVLGTVYGTVGLVLLLTFIWMNRTGQSNYQKKISTTRCDSPECLRCGTAHSLTLVRQKLMDRLDDFCKKTLLSTSSTSEFHAGISKVEMLINSAMTKHAIHHSIFAESGYDTDNEEADAHPHVWMLPGLTRHAFWSSSFHISLHDIIASSEDPEIVRAIDNEFRLVNRSKQGWKFNSIPSGKWKVFSLYNQGRINEENCAKCPLTVHFLSTIKLAMQDHVFGNALFSVLQPGSCIEPHTGPCNYRLRCHLPLIVPSGYSIKVGRDISMWEEGKLVIFDDSFVHEVWSDLAEGQESQTGCNIGRAVLIFDIWHPQVTCLEKAAIKHIFK